MRSLRDLQDAVRKRWVRLAEQVVAEEREELITALQQQFGITREQANQEIGECTCWLRSRVKVLRLGNNYCDCEAESKYDTAHSLVKTRPNRSTCAE